MSPFSWKSSDYHFPASLSSYAWVCCWTSFREAHPLDRLRFRVGEGAVGTVDAGIEACPSSSSISEGAALTSGSKEWGPLSEVNGMK